METSIKIVPPYLNAEVYRSDTTGTSTQCFLDYIQTYTDGRILVGSSELTGRYWDGGACIYKNIVESQITDNSAKKSIQLTSGNTDGCFINSSSKVLLCEDTGSVSIWNHNDDAWNHWVEETSVAEHDNAALAVDCLEPGKQYVTVGADCNIKVWDVNEMICIRNYSAAHSRAINGISVRPKTSNTFATSSLDQYITLWDDNVANSVLDLMENDCGIRCIQWLDDNRLIFGDEAGVLGLVDIRNTDDDIKLTEFPAAIHKVVVNQQSHQLAVCCDNKIVSVCELSENDKSKVIYHDKKSHSNFVRGLVWDVDDKTRLHSVGWDGQIKTHSIIIA